MPNGARFGTFSIVAADVAAGFWGVAVTTQPMAVGATVPWAEWRVGAVATQAMSNYTYGPRGLALLRRGLSAEAAVRRLTRADAGRDHRQLGIVDRRGRSAAWTGPKCLAHALHVVGDGFTCQGNLLTGDDVVHATASAFERARGPLGGRMLTALAAGRKKGGDRRGHRSAAILVVHREPWFERTWSDRWADLRVDLSSRPLADLARIYRVDEAATRQFLRQHERERAHRRGR